MSTLSLKVFSSHRMVRQTDFYDILGNSSLMEARSTDTLFFVGPYPLIYFTCSVPYWTCTVRVPPPPPPSLKAVRQWGEYEFPAWLIVLKRNPAQQSSPQLPGATEFVSSPPPLPSGHKSFEIYILYKMFSQSSCPQYNNLVSALLQIYRTGNSPGFFVDIHVTGQVLLYSRYTSTCNRPELCWIAHINVTVQDSALLQMYKEQSTVLLYYRYTSFSSVFSCIAYTRMWTTV